MYNQIMVNLLKCDLINNTRGHAMTTSSVRKFKNKKYFAKYYDLYILLIPAVLFLIIFKYLPLMGNVIAFKDYQINLGNNMLDAIFKSEWVGFRQFERLFTDSDAFNAVYNTLIISFYKIVFLFPVPIILALMLNEMRNMAIKRVAQTVVYFPNFLSWAVIGAMFVQILQADGLLNTLIHLTGDSRISYLTDYRFFRAIIVVIEGWKSSGFGTIIFLAAIAGIEQEQYEAATVDGCGRFKKIWHITLPGIASTIAMVFIITLGVQIAYGSFEQILILYNPTVYKTGDIILTFAYRKGLGSLDFSFSTAVGMLNAIVGVIVIFISNFFCKKTFGKSIW